MINNIRKIRIKRGMTLTSLAAKLNISKGNLSQIETNKIDLTQENLNKISDILSVSVLEILGQQPISAEKIINIRFTNDITSVNSQDEFKNFDTFMLDEKFLFFFGVKNFKDIIFFKMPNNSMYPMIETGDVIAIDPNVNEILRDGLYLIKEQGVLQVKKATINKENEKINISTLNKQTIGSVENNYTMSELKGNVWGRVLLYCKKLGL